MGQKPITDRLVLPSRLEEVARVEQTVLDAAAARGYDDPARFAIKLALEEALINAIKHGNCGESSRQVTVHFCVTDEQVEISVCDEGCGFRPEVVPDPTLDENLEKPNGRGLMLMHAYMSEVRHNDTGNCVTLIKRRGDD